MKLREWDIKDKEIQGLRDDIKRILNYGKYQKQIITTAPNWAARPGEEVIYAPSSGGATNYFYLNSAWISSWSVSF